MQLLVLTEGVDSISHGVSIFALCPLSIEAKPWASLTGLPMVSQACMAAAQRSSRLVVLYGYDTSCLITMLQELVMVSEEAVQGEALVVQKRQSSYRATSGCQNCSQVTCRIWSLLS